MSDELNTSRWYGRNYVRIVCKGGDHPGPCRDGTVDPFTGPFIVSHFTYLWSCIQNNYAKAIDQNKYRNRFL